MNQCDYKTAVELFSVLGIDTQKDSDLSRGYFILSLYNKLPVDERGYYANDSICTKFEKLMDRYQIEYFETSGEDNEIIYSNVDLLRDLLQRNNLFDARAFFSVFSPWIVADWDAYVGLQSGDKKDGIALVVLVKLLQWHEKFAMEESPFGLDLKSFYGSSKEISEYWTTVLKLSEIQFYDYWNAVFFYNCANIPVKTNGNISKAIASYKQYFLPMKKLLDDYCDINKNRNMLEHAFNPWKVRADKNHSPIESGVTAEETLYNMSAFKIRNEKATDVIRSAFYSNSRNDSAFECSYLFDQFASNISQESRVLIVNPSPDFILKCMSDKHCSSLSYLYFSVPDNIVAMCYSKEFSRESFISYEDISKLSGIDRVLIMSRDHPIERLNDLLSALSVCNPDALVLAVLPSAAFESAQNLAKDICVKEDCNIDKLLILPNKITHSNPRKKVLLFIRKGSNNPPLDTILFYEALSDSKGQILYIHKEHWCISTDVFYEGRSTILSLKKEAEKKRNLPIGGKETRDQARVYRFSKEIQLCYTILTKRKNRFAGKAYYCEIQRSESRRQRGKRLTVIIEKGLRCETEGEVLKQMETVPFDERVTPYIVKDVCSAYASDMELISMKTLWFCCRDKLLKSSKYDEEIAKKIFCTDSQELAEICPSSAYESDFCYAMSRLFNSDAQSVPLKLWRQVDIILETAVSEKYIHFNPLAGLMRKLSSQATEEQREVRNALTKKTFTLEEEGKILAFISAETKIRFGPKPAKRYEVESIWLVSAIRLFTGMVVKEICALKWSDFIKVPGMDSYQFLVSKRLSDDGRVAVNLPPDDCKKFRRVPVTHALAAMLIARKQYLSEVRMMPGEQILEMPIILCKEPDEGPLKDFSKYYCKPRVATEQCKAVIAAVDVQKLLLLLPDDEGELETDISKPQGDIFRSNFKYRANHTCFFTRGEINYMLGIEPPNTFSRHYCDYTNDFIQCAIAQKLQRWTALHPILTHIRNSCTCQTVIMKRQSTDICGPVSTGNSAMDIFMEIPVACGGGTLDIEIESNHGYSGNLTFYTDGGKENDE